jgi:hypothetical protein
MKVTVQLLDGKQIHPIFAPDHTNTVKAFYADLFAKHEIAGYVILFDNGDVLAEGKVL